MGTSMDHQFNLRWNNHTNNILQVFMEQLTNENLVDVTLSCQGQFLKAHKMVLSACSPYFQDLFGIHQVQHPVIILSGMKFKDIKMVVEFMYKGEIKVLEAELDGLLAVAESLQVKGLSNVRNKYEKGEIQGSEGGHAPKQSHNPQENLDDKSSGQNNTASEPSKTCRKRKRTPDRPKEMPTSEESPSKSQKQKSNSPSLDKPKANDDDDLSTIRVEPLYIKDIDDENEDESSWDPSKLVIDMDPLQDRDEEADSPSDQVSNKASETLQLLKVKPISQMMSSTNQTSQNINHTKPMATTKQTTKLKRLIPKPPPNIVSSLNNRNEVDSSEKTNNAAEGTFSNSTKENSVEINSVIGGKKQKIPRPPNAFMIFANEWRRKIAFEYPNESNKEISVRLGAKWKNLTAEKKEPYYSASRQADEEHKRKYPNYYYSPKEARLRKSEAQARRRVASAAVPKRGSKPATDPLRFVKVYIKDPSMTSNSVFLTAYGSQALQVKEESIDCDESQDQNLEEEFLKMVEEGHVEAEIEEDNKDLEADSSQIHQQNNGTEGGGAESG